MEFDWRNTGDYGSVAEVIDTAQNIPQLHPHLERVARSILWARPLLFPIARADCEWVFVRVCAFIADYGYL